MVRSCGDMYIKQNNVFNKNKSHFFQESPSGITVADQLIVGYLQSMDKMNLSRLLLNPGTGKSGEFEPGTY